MADRTNDAAPRASEAHREAEQASGQEIVTQDRHVPDFAARELDPALNPLAIDPCHFDYAHAIAFARWCIDRFESIQIVLIHADRGNTMEVARPSNKSGRGKSTTPAKLFGPETSDDKIRRWLEHNRKGWNVYWSVNPTRNSIEKGDKDDVTHVVMAHVDADGERTSSVQKLRELGMSFCIDSGNGFWGFRLLREPIQITPDDHGCTYPKEGPHGTPLDGDFARYGGEERPFDPEHRGQVIREIEARNRHLKNLFDGGDSAQNVDRITRMPGTINWPTKTKVERGCKPAVARLVMPDGELRTFPLDDMPAEYKDKPKVAEGGTAVNVSGDVRRTTNLDDLPERVSGRCKVVIRQGLDPDQPLDGDDQSRSAWLWYAVNEMVRCEVDDDTIYGIITDPEWGISVSVLDKGSEEQVRRYAVKQIRDAKAGLEDFDTDNKHVPRNTRRNFRLALSKLRVCVWRDLFAGRDHVHGLDEFDLGPELTDEAERRLRFLLCERFGFKTVPKEAWHEFVSDACWLNRRNPARDYFEALPPWDGMKRLERLLPDYFGAEDTGLHREFGRLHMCAAVKRVYEPGAKYDEVLVLEGAQGGLKSSGIEALCPYTEWFLDDLPLGADAKVVIEMTQGKLFVELAELNGLSKKEVDRVKAMVSRRCDRARAAYGRRARDVLRQFVFWGSTNDGEYLRDQTGNRRFWPAKAGTVNIDAIKRDRDQLWAEALHQVREGTSIRLDPKLYAAAAAAQAGRTQEDPFERRLSEALDRLDEIAHVRVLSDDLWTILGVQIERQPQHSRTFGEACKRLGLRQQTLRWNGNRRSFRVRGDEKQARTFGWNGERFVEATPGEVGAF